MKTHATTEHIWTDKRPCWDGGAITLRVGEGNPAGSVVAVKDRVWLPCTEDFPLRAAILAREILRLAGDSGSLRDLLRQALAELNYFKAKYAEFRPPLLNEIERVLAEKTGE